VLKDRADSELLEAIHRAARGEEYVSPRVATGVRMLRQAVAGDDLSPREVEVLRLIALGHTSVEIAAKLQLSRRTVETCRARILHKLGCRTRADLVELALRRHLIGSRRRQQFDRRVHRQVDAHQGSLTRPDDARRAVFDHHRRGLATDDRRWLQRHTQHRPKMLDLSSSVRPRLRGVWHKWACVWSVPFGVALVLVAHDARARVAVSVYAATLAALFGVSALYHRVNWTSISAQRWMRRLDHSMIFMVIAGTYTPFALLALHGEIAQAILVTVWTGALAGAIFNLLWTNAPAWLLAAVYISLGWVAVVAVSQLTATIGVAGLALLGLGGLLYTAGAVIYAVERPNPFPGVFGYHEVFHALVIAAAAIQYAVIAFWVLPA
jgi:hemolysin III